MKTAILSILFCATALEAGVACVSQADGAWSNPGTWTICGGAVPGNGDTATIKHNVTVGSNVTVGASPNEQYNLIPAIHVLSDATFLGKVTVQSGATLIVRGDIKMTSVASSTTR